MQRLRELRGVQSPATPSIPLQTSDYRAVRQKDLDEDADADLEGSHVQEQPQGNVRPVTRLSTLGSLAATPWIMHVLLVLVNIFTFAYLLQRGPSDTICTKKLSSWSPAIDAGIVQYKTIPVNGSMELENQYRGKPNTEIDAAWANITISVPKLRLSAIELRGLKKATDGVYKEESDYAVQLEIYELLGCLNKLRKASYRSQYPEIREGTDGFNEKAWHNDLDHCTDMLRVELMCKSDVDIVTYSIGSDHRPEFTAVKKCRNFDDILEWSYSNIKGLNLPAATRYG